MDYEGRECTKIESVTNVEDPYLQRLIKRITVQRNTQILHQMNFPNLDTMTLGSDAWAEAVYASGPSRNSEGRSRPTHRYFSVADEGIEEGVFEGRNEYITFLLLCVLKNAGVISRFKGQPFRLSKDQHGVDAYPDFIFDTVDDRRFVLEAKAKRFIDEDEQRQLETVNDAFVDTSITYLLWTDKWPLYRPVVHAMNSLRRAHRQCYSDAQLQIIKEAVQRSPKTLGQLRKCTETGHFDQILAAAYKGMVFINFFQPITDHTQVSGELDKRMWEMLLKTQVKGSSGWDAGIPS